MILDEPTEQMLTKQYLATVIRLTDLHGFVLESERNYKNQPTWERAWLAYGDLEPTAHELAEAQAIINELGHDPNSPLSQSISQRTVTMLDAAARAVMVYRKKSSHTKTSGYAGTIREAWLGTVGDTVQGESIPVMLVRSHEHHGDYGKTHFNVFCTIDGYMLKWATGTWGNTQSIGDEFVITGFKVKAHEIDSYSGEFLTVVTHVKFEQGDIS